MAQPSSTLAFPILEGHTYANLTTFRKSGAAVVTPVWFVEYNGKVYVMTLATAGKTKRIRNNSQVQLAPCTRSGEPLGPTVDAVARVLAPEEDTVARQALGRKYGLLKRLFDLVFKLRRNPQAHLEITPGQGTSPYIASQSTA